MATGRPSTDSALLPTVSVMRTPSARVTTAKRVPGCQLICAWTCASMARKPESPAGATGSAYAMRSRSNAIALPATNTFAFVGVTGTPAAGAGTASIPLSAAAAQSTPTDRQITGRTSPS